MSTDPETEARSSSTLESSTTDLWEVVEPTSEPLSSRWFVPVVLLILTLATPWYLPEEIAGRFILGLPLWVWVTLAGAVGLASITSYGALRLWRDE